MVGVASVKLLTEIDVVAGRMREGKKAIVASAMTSVEERTNTEWRHKRNTGHGA